MVAIRFEESRDNVPVPWNCPVWTTKEGKRIPIVHMETQHLLNVRKRLLAAGKGAMRRYRLFRMILDEGDSSVVRRLNHTNARLQWMDLWYERLNVELARRVQNGEETSSDTLEIPASLPAVPTWRARIASSIDRVRHLLSTTQRGARNQ